MVEHSYVMVVRLSYRAVIQRPFLNRGTTLFHERGSTLLQECGPTLFLDRGTILLPDRDTSLLQECGTTSISGQWYNTLTRS